MPRIHIIHENAEWTAPLLRELDALSAPYREWHLDSGAIELSGTPPPGIYYSRMSASSHTRGHRYAPELTGCFLDWLQSRGAWVVNPRAALDLEISKVAQYAALSRHGITTPRTVAAVGKDALVSAAKTLRGTFITKHNRAGKGLGVRLFEDVAALEALVGSGEYARSVDGVTLVQEYIEAPTPHITRVEFIGRRLLYAVRVDTSEGFELCPAQSCAPEDAFCPAGQAATGAKFEILEDFHHPLVAKYQRFMSAEQVDVAAFEFIVDAAGRPYTYDINTNTNYNPDAEARAGVSGMRVLAEFLVSELARWRRSSSRSHAA
jgi:hypothetical protein